VRPGEAGPGLRAPGLRVSIMRGMSAPKPAPVTSSVARIAAFRWLNGLLALIILVSLIIQIALVVRGAGDANTGQELPGGLGDRLFSTFSFFTIQSNIIVGVVAFLLWLRPLRDGRVWRIAVLDALLGITVTGIVFAVLLAPLLNLSGWSLLASEGLHTVSPILAVAVWLLFGPRPRLTWASVAGSFVWPAAWLVYTFVRGAIIHWYPYPFLNVTHLGFGPALVNAVLILVASGVLSCVYLLIDRKTPALLRG
jgi:hypothetical protein